MGRGGKVSLCGWGRGRGLMGIEFHGMPEIMMRRVLGVLVKKGQAQMFGTEDEMGVKFF